MLSVRRFCCLLPILVLACSVDKGWSKVVRDYDSAKKPVVQSTPDNNERSPHSEAWPVGVRGIWLDSHYIGQLKRTRSALEAGQSVRVAMLEIAGDTSGLSITIIVNFHEGVTRAIGELAIVQGKICRFGFEPSYSAYPSDFRVNSFKTVDTLWWKVEEDESAVEQCFVKIEGTVENFVLDVCLAGSYVDTLGRSFRFSRLGSAIWPNDSMTISPWLSAFFAGCDAFMVLGRRTDDDYPLRYGFERNGNYLRIFEVEYDGPELNCRSSPLYELQRVSTEGRL